MSALDELKRDFSGKVAGGLQRLSRVINGAEMDFYFAPMTLKEQAQIRQHMDKDIAEGIAMCLVVRARNASGEKMFRRADLTELMISVDSNVISSIVDEMATSSRIEADEIPEPRRSATQTD